MQTLESRNEIVHELDRLIRSRVPIIAVNTHEEPRFMDILGEIKKLKMHQHKPVYVWSKESGLMRANADGSRAMVGTDQCFMPEQALRAVMDLPPFPMNPDDKNDPRTAVMGLVVLADLAEYLNSPDIIRLIREAYWQLRNQFVNVFIVGHDFPLIPSLEKEVRIFDLGLPHKDEISKRLDERLAVVKEEKRADVDEAAREEIIDAMAGLTLYEADTALAIAAITLGKLSREAVPIILEQKREAIRASASLTYTPPVPLKFFGGYENLIEMVLRAAETFHPDAKKFGIDPHKGFLLLGPPGCGKDYLMQVIAALVRRALLKMEMGMIMGEGGGIIGQSAVTSKRAMNLAEAEKCVLGISEFEKGFGGLSSSSRSDAGETSRMIGMWLNWFSEQQSVMVVATANDLTQLAPEQIREGRFGAKVWVGLPSVADRQSIFRVHLLKREKDPETFKLDRAAEMADRFSGAEIEQAVKNAILYAWSEGKGTREVNDKDIERGIKDITPTGKINAAEIARLEAWAVENLGAVLASDKDALTKSSATKGLTANDKWEFDS